MKEVIKYYISHFKRFIVFIPVSIFLLLISVIKTNKSIILKGDTTEFNNVITVVDGYEPKGSFNTIYVISYVNTTPFLAFITPMLKDGEIYDTPESQLGYTLIDQYNAGKIQYQSALSNSLVVAFSEAKKNDETIDIDYSFQGFYVTGYGVNSKFRINDNITKIKAASNQNEEVTIQDETLFRYVINHRTNGDIYTVIRDNVELEITLKEENTFSAYSMYNIKSTYPKVTIKSEDVGGPSGGLLQTLSTYNQLTEEDLTHGLKICGTGTIAYDGSVGIIGGIKEKIYTAYRNHMDVFLCPKGNYEEALEAYSNLPSTTMKLVMVEKFSDAISYLTEGYKNDFR